MTRIIDVTDDSPLTLSALTLRDGADDAVSVLNAPGGATLTLDRVDLRSNHSAQGADGNGAIALKGGSLTMRSGQVVGNVAGGTGHTVTGGIVKAQDAEVDVDGVLFDANSAGGGGGSGAAVGALFALTDGAAPNSTLKLTTVTATNNHGGGGGAAAGDGLVDAAGYDVTATNSSFRGNILGGGDGTAAGFGIFTATAASSRSASVSLDGVTVSDNAIGVGAAGGTGGAVSLSTSASNATLVADVVRSAILDNDVGGQGGLGFGGAINADGDRVRRPRRRRGSALDDLRKPRRRRNGRRRWRRLDLELRLGHDELAADPAGDDLWQHRRQLGRPRRLRRRSGDRAVVVARRHRHDDRRQPRDRPQGPRRRNLRGGRQYHEFDHRRQHGRRPRQLPRVADVARPQPRERKHVRPDGGRRRHQRRPRARTAGQLRRRAPGPGVAAGQQGGECRRGLHLCDRRARRLAPPGHRVRHRCGRGAAARTRDARSDEPHPVQRNTERSARSAPRTP